MTPVKMVKIILAAEVQVELNLIFLPLLDQPAVTVGLE
jgi:hypothetical protein